jgi:hypothetical protein
MGYLERAHLPGQLLLPGRNGSRAGSVVLDRDAMPTGRPECRGGAEGFGGWGGGGAWVEEEPGIGKSTLVGAGRAGAAGLGCAVFSAAADPLRARFPLGVMLDCLGVDAVSAEGERGE